MELAHLEDTYVAICFNLTVNKLIINKKQNNLYSTADHSGFNDIP